MHVSQGSATEHKALITSQRMPRHLYRAYGAQFAMSRAEIKRRPIEFYARCAISRGSRADLAQISRRSRADLAQIHFGVHEMRVADLGDCDLRLRRWLVTPHDEMHRAGFLPMWRAYTAKEKVITNLDHDHKLR